MDRRSFLRGMAALPVLAVMPAITSALEVARVAKTIPAHQRQYFSGEVVHLYKPIVVRDGFYMNNCQVICHDCDAMHITQGINNFTITNNCISGTRRGFVWCEHGN